MTFMQLTIIVVSFSRKPITVSLIASRAFRRQVGEAGSVSNDTSTTNLLSSSPPSSTHSNQVRVTPGMCSTAYERLLFDFA